MKPKRARTTAARSTSTQKVPATSRSSPAAASASGPGRTMMGRRVVTPSAVVTLTRLPARKRYTPIPGYENGCTARITRAAPVGDGARVKAVIWLPYRCGTIQGASSMEPMVYGVGASSRTRCPCTVWSRSPPRSQRTSPAISSTVTGVSPDCAVSAPSDRNTIALTSAR